MITNSFLLLLILGFCHHLNQKCVEIESQEIERVFIVNDIKLKKWLIEIIKMRNDTKCGCLNSNHNNVDKECVYSLAQTDQNSKQNSTNFYILISIIGSIVLIISSIIIFRKCKKDYINVNSYF
jgi:hypothetical protein